MSNFIGLLFLIMSIVSLLLHSRNGSGPRDIQSVWAFLIISNAWFAGGS